jgi:hypothetical protein
MGDYAPVFLPGQTMTSQASGTITGGDLLVVSGNGTVAKATALADPKYVGVAGHDAVSSQKVTYVAANAVHESIADGTVTAGDQISTTNTANRQVKTVVPAATTISAAPTDVEIETAVSNARAIIGTALTTAADNNTVRWMQR